MKKFWLTLILCLTCAFCAVGLIACGTGEIADKRDPQIVGIYNTYVAYAEENGETPLSYEEWLAFIKGEKGDKGDTGAQGEKGQDGKDGVNGKDGQNGKDGKDGKSAYETWLANGHTGTQADFLTWLKGEKGADGQDGQNGKDGIDGVGVKNVEIDDNGDLIITLTNDNKINAGKVKDVHGHTVVEKEVIERETSCTKTGLKYVVCETCGEIIRTVIEDITPHNYQDGVCTGCGAIQPPTDEKYFTFNLLDDDTYEIKAKDKTELPANVLLPSTYNGKPVSSIGSFSDCQALISIIIPDSIKSIGRGAFSGCSRLTSIIFSENSTLESIGENGFYACRNLKIIILPSNITKIEVGVFSESGITNIIIPNSVKSIGVSAFGGGRLKNITMGVNISFIDSYAFSSCGSLSIIFEGTKEQWGAILKGIDWNEYTSVVVHCTDGDVEI